MKKLVFLPVAFAIFIALASCAAREITPEPSVSPTEPQASLESPSLTTPDAIPREFAFESETHNYDIDMDGDGFEDDISVVLYTDEPLGYESGLFTVIEITVNGEQFMAYGDNITDELSFVSFTSAGSQLCIREYGSSADDGTHIISYNGESISHFLMTGFIRDYDENGTILTGYNYLYISDGAAPQWSYWKYDRTGKIELMPVDKSQLIGKTLVFNFDVPLTLEPDDKGISHLVALHYANYIDEYIAQFGENFAFLLNTLKEAEIVDVDFIDQYNDGNIWPWLKLKAPDGSVGWMSAVFTGD